MANEGYIPYGLDRSSKWRGDIQGARSRLRNAKIRQSSEPGRLLDQALGQATDDLTFAYEKYNERAGQISALETEQNLRRREAMSEVESSNLTIEELNDQLSRAQKGSPLYYDLRRQLIQQRKIRDNWQAAVDANTRKENAKTRTDQANRRAQNKMASAELSEMEAGSRLVDSVLNPSEMTEKDKIKNEQRMLNHRLDRIFAGREGKPERLEIDGIVGPKTLAAREMLEAMTLPGGEEESVLSISTMAPGLSGLSGVGMDNSGMGTRSISSPSDVIGIGSIRQSPIGGDVNLSRAVRKEETPGPLFNMAMDPTFYRRGG